MDPLLKWPGGKRWLAAASVFYLHGTYRRYLEPFLGGGAFLFALEPEQATASDINSDLIECYQAVRKNSGLVLRELDSLVPTKEDYYRIRDDWKPRGKYQRAARLIYLLRHSWNGLYRVNGDGDFNVPYCPRPRKGKLTIATMSSFQSLLNRVVLKCQNFSDTITEAEAGDFIFADPPYFQNGRETFDRYHSVHFFRDPAQARLAKCLHEAEDRGAAWILTNGSQRQLQVHFPEHEIFPVSRHSSIAARPESRGGITEYIVLSNSETLRPLRQALLRGGGQIPSRPPADTAAS